MEEQKLNIDVLLQAPDSDLNSIMSELRNGRLTPLPNAEEYTKQLNPRLHDVMNPRLRPDKVVNVDPNSPDYGATRNVMVNSDNDGLGDNMRLERVTRIALSYQKLIVKRAVGVTFGNPVRYKAHPQDEGEENLLEAIQRVLHDVKEQSLNRKVAREIYGMTECAERWYLVEGDEEHYNYSDAGTRFKVRCVVFSPKYGDLLYPYFDDNRDMIAFSRQYTKKDADLKTRTYFETYTKDYFYMWTCQESEKGSLKSRNWEACPGYPMRNPYGKIPIIYGNQEEPEYKDVESLIAELEKRLSIFGDTNDYHGSPKIIVKGHVNSFCKKGEAGAVMELDEGADASYLAWQQAPDAVKEEINILKELIHTLTQTPDLSWESVKGMNVSGVALKLMFMDAILKVKDKEEIWTDFLQRRINLLKAMLSHIDVNFAEAAKTLMVDPEIEPFIVRDEQEMVNIVSAAVGGGQIASKKTALSRLGWSDNVDLEIEEINNEEEFTNSFEQSEPTLA